MERETFDFSETPSSLLLPDVLMNWEVAEMKIVEARSKKTYCNVCKTDRGKKMIALTYEIVEPADYKGAQLTENFVIGIDSDPCAHRPETLTGRVFGAVFFRNLLDMLGVPGNDMWGVVKKRFQAFVVSKMIDGEEGKRAINNVSGKKYPIGTMLPGQETPDNLYPRGVERLSELVKHSNGASNIQPKEMSCPRCGKSFPSDEIDDHVVECNA